jgi:uncharacterized protein YecE (DUF72 family)
MGTLGSLESHFAQPHRTEGAKSVVEKVLVGVSGFSYASWKGRFYPKEMKSDEFLTYYARRLDSVEINSSFYATPTEATVKNWSAKTGEKFRFSFKASRRITHILKLGKGASDEADKLSKVLDLLGSRRGAVLFQLPPYLKQDTALLDGFLSKTSGIKNRVFEFRHESWLQEPTYRLLERQGAGFCIAETEDMKPAFQVTGGLAYFRLRKDSYDAKAIDHWAKKITEVAGDVRECYAYLRHDETGENAILAQRLSEKIAV